MELNQTDNFGSTGKSRYSGKNEIESRVLGNSSLDFNTSLKDLSSSKLKSGGFQSPETRSLYIKRKDVLQKHMEKLFDSNEQHFKIVRGEVGRQFRPKDMILDYKKGAESLYQKDFKFHPNYKRVPKVNADFFAGFDTQQPMELSTINRTDFIPHRIEKVGSEKKEDVKQFLPFAGDSSYNTSFANWGPNPVSFIKPRIIPTVIKGLPFTGQSLYNENFTGKQVNQQLDKDDIIIFQTTKRGQFKSPMNPDFPFLSETTTGSTYLPSITSTHSFKLKQKFETPLPTYNGQYTSINKKDFTDKLALHKCCDIDCLICSRQIKK